MLVPKFPRVSGQVRPHSGGEARGAPAEREGRETGRNEVQEETGIDRAELLAVLRASAFTLREMRCLAAL